MKDGNKSNNSDLKSIEQSYWECIFSSVPGGAANGFVLGGILIHMTLF